MIHGGMTFKKRADYLTYLRQREVSIEPKVKWSGAYFDKRLGGFFSIIRPQLPLKENARYEDWKICFESYFPHLKDGLILIGSSLGGIFLAKYLAENKFPKKISAVYLIAPPFDGNMSTEDLVGGFRLPKDLSGLDECASRVQLFFSEDDEVVTPYHADKYRRSLKRGQIRIFKSKNGHFKLRSFPELVRLIKEDRQAIKK